MFGLKKLNQRREGATKMTTLELEEAIEWLESEDNLYASGYTIREIIKPVLQAARSYSKLVTESKALDSGEAQSGGGIGAFTFPGSLGAVPIREDGSPVPLPEGVMSAGDLSMGGKLLAEKVMQYCDCRYGHTDIHLAAMEIERMVKPLLNALDNKLPKNIICAESFAETMLFHATGYLGGTHESKSETMAIHIRERDSALLASRVPDDYSWHGPLQVFLRIHSHFINRETGFVKTFQELKELCVKEIRDAMESAPTNTKQQGD